jgi:hypothetical protein
MYATLGEGRRCKRKRKEGKEGGKEEGGKGRKMEEKGGRGGKRGKKRKRGKRRGRKGKKVGGEGRDEGICINSCQDPESMFFFESDNGETWENELNEFFFEAGTRQKLKFTEVLDKINSFVSKNKKLASRKKKKRSKVHDAGETFSLPSLPSFPSFPSSLPPFLSFSLPLGPCLLLSPLSSILLPPLPSPLVSLPPLSPSGIHSLSQNSKSWTEILKRSFKPKIEIGCSSNPHTSSRRKSTER